MGETSDEQDAETEFKARLVGVMARQLVRLDIDRFDRMVEEALNRVRSRLAAPALARAEAEAARMRRSLELSRDIKLAELEGRKGDSAAFRKEMGRLLRKWKSPQVKLSPPSLQSIARGERHDRGMHLVDAPSLQDFAARLADFDVATELGVFDYPMIFLPLETAAERVEKVAMIVEAGADPFATRPDGGTVLHALAAQRRLDVEDQGDLVDLMLSFGLDIDTSDVFGRNPIIEAIAHGGEREIKALLERGADVNRRFPPEGAPRGFEGKTLLMMAASRSKIFNELLEHGADPAFTAEDGQTVVVYINSEIARIDRDLANPRNSPGLVKTWTRFRNNYIRSLKAVTDI